MSPLTRITCVAVSLAIIPSAHAHAQTSLDSAFGTTITDQWRFEEARQYDFWLGKWEGRWRFRPQGQFFHADVSMRLEHWLFPVLGGKAIIELSLSQDRTPANRVAGFSIRYYDPDKERWVMAQDWPGWTQRGFVDQLQGFEREGRVQVFSTYVTPSGQQRTRRYTFSDVRDGYFRWQSHSTGDSARTWAPGSIVEFHRTQPHFMLGTAGSPMPNVVNEPFCREAPFRNLDDLDGEWRDESGTTLVTARFNAGCALMGVMREGPDSHRNLFAITHVPQKQTWTMLTLPDTPGAPHSLWAGTMSGEGSIVFNRNDALVIGEELEVLDVSTLIPESPTETIAFIPSESGIIIRHSSFRGGSWTETGTFNFTRSR